MISLTAYRASFPTLTGTDRLPHAMQRAAAGAQALALAAAVGLVLIALAPALVGMRSLVVVGGSMEPTIPRGAVVLIQPVEPAALRVGDVITFSRADEPDTLVTHRVTGLELGADGPALRTRGDNNESDDIWTVRGDETAGRVVAHVPLAGYALAMAGTSEARLALIAVIIVALVAQQLRRPAEAGASATTVAA